MLNKKLMILAIFLVSLLAVSAVSAADNTASDILSTDTANEIAVIEEDGVILKENNIGTFTDLANEIANATSQLDLTRDYGYADDDSGYKEGITIDKSIVINGNGYTINGNNQARIFKIDASDVVLNNINFVNCSADNGGAIFWSSDNGTLSNCNFMNCSADTFGGTTYFSSDNGTISNCNFMNCSADDGGAIYWSSDNGTLSNCNFMNCSADDFGGAIYWSGNIYYYDDNTTSIWGDNGALFNCSFIDCTAQYYGGAVCWMGPRGCINESIFIRCHAERGGGGIYSNGINCSLINPTFKDNTAGNGKFADYYGIRPIISTYLIVPDINITYGNWEYLNVTLRYFNNNPLANEIVYYVLDDIKRTGRTDSEGKASLWISQILDPKNYTVFIYYNGNGIYNSTKTTANIYVDKSPTIISAENTTVKYNDSNGRLVATLTSGKGIPLSANIIVTLNGVKYTLKSNSQGQISISTADLAPGEYTATITYKGNSKYKPTSTTIKVTVNNKLTSSIVTADHFSVKQGDAYSKIIATLTDEEGVPLSDYMVVNLNGANYTLKSNSKGQISVSTGKLAIGAYKAKITYNGNSEYNPSTTTTKIYVTNKLTSVVSAEDVGVKYNDTNGKFVATLTNSKGTPLSANIVINLNGVNYKLKTNSKGQASVSTKDLKLGEYTAKITYNGNSKYNPSTTTAKVTVNNKLISVVSAEDVTVKPGDANGKFIATLTNTEGIPLSANMEVNLNGKDYTLKSDSQGQIILSTKDLATGTYTATVTYKGNSKYNPSTTTAKITVNLDTHISGVYDPKTKDVIGTLTNSEGIPLSANVVVSLNGVNYALKSNSKGMFKVSAKNLAIGNYTAKLLYKGNSKYAPSTTTVKVTVNKLISCISGTYNAETKEVVGKLTNYAGTPLSANVVVNLNGVNYALKSDYKGQFKVSAKDLAPGNYTAKLVYRGNSKYDSSRKTVNVVIP